VEIVRECPQSVRRYASPVPRRVVKRHFPLIIGTGGAVLIAMGVLWTGELVQLNIKAQHLLDSVGFDFFNHV
jgi:uncharacterized membrane protein